MSVSKAWANNPENQKRAAELYRSAEFPTVQRIAELLGTTHQTIGHTLRLVIPDAERRALAAVRYSAAKEGQKNPMKGKKGAAHHNWKGLCSDGHGYMTCLHGGRRQLVHRVVMAEALGLAELPSELEVHHIDDNKTNNALDNLALVTGRGHRALHLRQLREPKDAALKLSTIAAAVRSMTSQ